MFDDLNNAPPVPGSQNKAEDIFAGVEKPTQGIGLPKPPVFEPRDPSLPKPPEAFESVMENKKYFVIGASVLVLLIVAIGGWYGLKNFSTFFVKSKTVVTETPLPVENILVEEKRAEITQPSANVLPELATSSLGLGAGAIAGIGATSTEIAPPVMVAENKDTDGDGLPDKEETVQATNPLLIDTDSDGLSDYEEVKIYKTDPLKTDTDADGFKDGDEVKNGYNPLGGGKLINTNNSASGL